MIHYGTTTPLYEPNLYDKLTGYDWGRDRCLRNSLEAYKCFSQYMINVRNNIGWSNTVVQHVNARALENAGGFDTPAIQFWKIVQNQLFDWIDETGYDITDLPKYEDVLKILDMRTENALDYEKMMRDRKRFLLDVAGNTAGDIWSYWNMLPKEVRIGAYIIGGVALIGYTLPILTTITRTTKLLFKDKN